MTNTQDPPRTNQETDQTHLSFIKPHQHRTNSTNTNQDQSELHMSDITIIP